MDRPRRRPLPASDPLGSTGATALIALELTQEVELAAHDQLLDETSG